ncbi:MAG TPA: alpha/beta fold hydrolase [Aquabacterium sp.]|nr:alpha/beta fold hydrolase [Aquabacterium sp.]
MALPQTIHYKGDKRGVLLFHGLSSSPLELQYLARGLHRAGYTVKVPVMQGYTYGLMNPAHTAQEWVTSAVAELKQFQLECESVVIGGLCLGAILSLRVAELCSNELDGVMALSTAFHYDGWGNPWYTPLLPLARYVPISQRIRIREREPFGVKDERMRAWISRQMKELGDSDAGAASLCVRDILQARSLIAMTRRGLSRIACPTLLIHAKEDECSTPRSSIEVAEAVQSRRIRLVLLQDSYHMISIDREKDLVLNEMKQFLSAGEQSCNNPTPIERMNVLSLFEPRKGVAK